MGNLRTEFYSYTGQRITRDEGCLTLLDIAVGLGRVCRYGGGSTQFWPVLLHSFIVADLVPPELEAYGLLHDMTDVLFSDIPKPFKTVETLALQHRIHNRQLLNFGLPLLGEDDEERVQVADTRAFIGEKGILAPAAMVKALPGRDQEAEDLTRYYFQSYPIEALVNADGQPVQVFIARARRTIKEAQLGRPSR